MRNKEQCGDGLIYPDFAMIFIQTFTSPKIVIPREPWLKEVTEGNIDDQLFMHHQNMVQRYELPGFDVKIKITVGEGKQQKEAVVEGNVRVWMTVFFDATVEISYRLLVLNSERFRDIAFASSSVDLDTDQLIALAGVVQHVEHWVYKEQEKRQEIDGCVRDISVSNLMFDEKSAWRVENVQDGNLTFQEIQRRYRNLVDKSSDDEFKYKDHHYTFIDVWETVEHQGKVCFATMAEDEIIEHIECHHRAELVGLMSLYPCEWPYRMDTSYDAICGPNIAIDTDDLVLANENMCVVFGTYGRRGVGSPTDWEKHVKRRDRYLVSWPEYLVLVEMLLAKKHTINYVLNKYIYNSTKAIATSAYEMIEQNSILTIRLSNMLLQLEAFRYLRYVSHKHMLNLTEERLQIAKDEMRLKDTFVQVGKSLNTVNNVAELKESSATKYILFFISVASLFGVLLEGDGSAPVFSMISNSLGVWTAVVLVSLSCVGIAYGLYLLLRWGVRWYQQKQRKKKGF